MAPSDRIIHAKAIELGKLAVRATTAAGSGHPTSALSLAHLVTVLLYRVMRWDPRHPAERTADRLVLSEGHAVPIVYAACADLGMTFGPSGAERAMTIDDLMTLRAIDSVLDGHPNPRLGFPFFDAATGSLGQGLSIAAGLGCAARLDGTERVAYCLIGDGESREGQIWEAMDFIVEHRLLNVVAIFNCNGLGQSDPVSPEQDWHHLAAKAAAFDWDVATIDGHDPGQIERALRAPREGRPRCIVARTVKGWGVPSIEGLGHHGTPVPPAQLDKVLAALDAQAAKLDAAAVSPEELRSLRPSPPSPPQSTPADARPGQTPSFADAVAADPKLAGALTASKAMSPRRAFGLALASVGRADTRVVAIDGDVKNSTYAEVFAKAHPERYFEGRIAEQNMVSVGAGLAAAGKVPFVSTFGRFLERGFDQVEMALISGAGLKLVGTHVGVTLAADGPSQMALADLAFMRALSEVDADGRPAIAVLTPADAVAAYRMVLSMAETPGAFYLRALRSDVPLLYEDSDTFPVGGHKVVRRGDGSGQRVVLAATGIMVHRCLDAAGPLARADIAATVVDAYSLPLETSPVLDLARELAAPILVVEDNYAGGLGSALAEAAAARRDGPLVRPLHVRRFPKSGRSAEDVLRYVGLSQQDIVEAAKRLIALD